MARGRFLSKDVSSSSKLGKVSDAAARLYFYCLPHHNRDGLIIGEPDQMLDKYVPILAIRQGWTADKVHELAQSMVQENLFEEHQCSQSGARVYLFVGHDRHQVLRYDREAPSEWVVPGVTGSGVGTELVKQGESTPESVAHGVRSLSGSLTTEGKGKGKGEVQGQVEETNSGPPGQPAPLGSGSLASTVGSVVGSIRPADSSCPNRTIGVPEVLGIWRDIWEDRQQVPPLTPLDRHDAQKAVELGTFDRWPTRDGLEEEFRRTLAGMEKKGLDLTLRWLVNHLGESWAEKRRGGEGDAPVFDAEAYRKQIGA